MIQGVNDAWRPHRAPYLPMAILTSGEYSGSKVFWARDYDIIQERIRTCQHVLMHSCIIIIIKDFLFYLEHHHIVVFIILGTRM